MKIIVRTHDVKFTLLLPNFLLFNSLTGSLISKAVATELRKSGTGNLKLNIDAWKAGRLLTQLRQARRKYGRFTLVDVESANGDIVKIIL
ncbi:MAG: hypothetical protein GX254_07670 [Clostridiales bacterium]|jgi:hypothetical protein|nr:hypothetical protein [Clostridiales bacterium]